MIELIPNMPDNVVGLKAIGKVTGEDYQNVVIPAVEAALKKHDKVRLLYNCGSEFDGFEAAAAWDDAKVGLKHLTHFEKIAVVTDHSWMNDAVKVFGVMTPGEVRTYDGSQLSDAEKWIVG